MPRHQIKPNRWSCLVTAFAMALDIPVAELIRLVGHDGSEIVNPELPEPGCRRGFHIQEMIEACWSQGHSVTPIEVFPQSMNAVYCEPRIIWFPSGIKGTREDGNWMRLYKHILRPPQGRGVLECVGPTWAHAMAVACGDVYDPDQQDSIIPFSKTAIEERGLFIRCFWRIERRC
jgi:hypothetical protein